MKLRVVQAHEGDCMLLFWEGKGEHVMLIDGGAAKTWDPHLKRALSDGGVDALDVLMVSHVDTDHTTGVKALLAELKDPDEESPLSLSVADLWLNTFSNTVDGKGKLSGRLQSLSAALAGGGLASTLAGVSDGDGITRAAGALGIEINRANGGAPFVLEDTPIVYTLDGLEMQVVGPTRANLDELEAKWDEWIKKQQARLKAKLSGLAAMADTSVPNLSSIQVLVLHKASGKRILFTGDGRGDHLLDGLEVQNLLDADGGIDVDVLKVAHHGSDRNSNQAFYERVRAPTYVVSADGKHGNPDVDTLSWIARAAKKQGREITIVLTNEPPSVKEFTRRWPAAEFGYRLVIRKDEDSYVDVEV